MIRGVCRWVHVFFEARDVDHRLIEGGFAVKISFKTTIVQLALK